MEVKKHIELSPTILSDCGLGGQVKLGRAESGRRGAQWGFLARQFTRTMLSEWDATVNSLADTVANSLSGI